MKETGLIISNQRRREMSKGQELLLQTMCKCVKDKTPLLFEDIVLCYYLGVKKSIHWANYELYHSTMCITGPHKDYDILVEFEKQSFIWNKKIRDLIKSWFVSAIGLLVIKGWLAVLPVIDIPV
jgi:hypothetical protein